MTSLTTPIGSSLFSRLLEPQVFVPPGGSPKPGDKGNYSVNLVIDPAKHADWIAKVEEVCDQLYQAELAKVPKGKKAPIKREPFLPFADDVNGDKEPTGLLRIKLSKKAGGITKSGQAWSRSVPFFDAQKEAFRPEAELGNGSMIRCSFEPFTYINMGYIGVSFQLRAVQVLAAKYHSTGGAQDFDDLKPEEFEEAVSQVEGGADF